MDFIRLIKKIINRYSSVVAVIQYFICNLEDVKQPHTSCKKCKGFPSICYAVIVYESLEKMLNEKVNGFLSKETNTETDE